MGLALTLVCRVCFEASGVDLKPGNKAHSSIHSRVGGILMSILCLECLL